MENDKHPLEIEPHPFFLRLIRPRSPNTYLIAPQGFPGDPDETSPVFATDAEQLRAAFEDIVGAKGSVRQEWRDGSMTHFVDETLLWRFKDDVRVQFIDLGGGRSTLAAYSASRIGYWDCGKNRRRLRHWVSLVRRRLGS